MSSQTGRRAAGRPGRRWSPVVAAVVLLPALVAVGLGTFSGPGDRALETHPPTEEPLTSVDLICPAPLADKPVLLLGHLSDPGTAPAGEVAFGLGTVTTPLDWAAGATFETAPTAAGVVTARGDRAAGVAATLAERTVAAAVTCDEPSSSQWFGGLGAGPTHASELELVNPDESTAVADVTVFGEQGILDVPALRGVAVPGGSRVLLKLAELLPQRGQLAMQVTVSRGRVGVHVVDRSDELGQGDVSAEWVPSQREPQLVTVLQGLPPTSGQHKLVVTNPGPDVAQVNVRVTTTAAAFAPAGLTEVQIPPESVGVITVSDAVNTAVADGQDSAAIALGLLVESTEPVAAVLRSVTDGDLSFSGSADVISQGLAPIPPSGDDDDAVMVVSGGVEPATGSLRFLDANGATVAEQPFDLASLVSASFPVPDGAALAEVTSGGVSATLVVAGPQGTVAVPVLEPRTSTLVPDVRAVLR